MPIRLLLADDHRMMLEGLRSLIDQDEELQLVGEARDGHDVVAAARKLSPHVIVMDVSMPALNGIEATRQILADYPHIKVVAISGHKKMEFIREMLDAGASAFVLKSRAYEELTQAVRESFNGRKYLSPEIAGSVVDEYVGLHSASRENTAFVMLTPREREVLQQLSEGASTKEMAADLGVSIKTVETHRRNIMEKLNLHSVAELTKYAIREGITSLDA
jgi:DNA-binding NarL/FixJ family response regulator